MQSQPIQVRSRIFHGDAFPSIFFLIVIIPLTNALNRADCV